MPVSHAHGRSHHQQQRSASTRPSRRITIDGNDVRITRSASAPARQVIIILTNNADILRYAQMFRREEEPTAYTAMILQHTSLPPTTLNDQDRHRERILTDLLEHELRDSIQGYLLRTRRSYPIHYIFRLPES